MAALEIKQIFFTNLLLLEFDPVSMEKKHRMVSFNKDMFVLPNKKALEEIIYFLFGKLDGNQSSREFRDCWPIFDKKQEQHFKKTVTTWLTQITKGEDRSHLPHSIPLFVSPSGDRVYYYLLLFSRYVLYKVLANELNKKCFRDFVGHPSLPPNPRVIYKMLTSLISTTRFRYVSRTKKTIETHETWTLTMEMFVKSYRGNTKAIKEMRKYLENSENILESESIPTLLGNPDSGTSARMEKVYEMGKGIDKFVEKVSHKKEIFDSFFDGSVGKYKLDGTTFDIVVPNQLIRDNEKEIVQKQIHSLHTGGKLDLLNLVKLWNISLKQHRDSFKEAGLTNLKGSHARTSHLLDLLKLCSKDLTILRQEVVESAIPEVKLSAERLFAEAKDKYLSNKSPNSLKVTPLVIGILTPLKMPSLPLNDSTLSPLGKKESFFPEGTINLEKTPEIMRRLKQEVDDRVKKNNNEVVLHHDDHNHHHHHADTRCSSIHSISTFNDPSDGIDENYLKPDHKKVAKNVARASFAISPKSHLVKISNVFDTSRPSRLLKPRNIASQSILPASLLMRKNEKSINSSHPIGSPSTSKKKDSHLDLLAERIVDRFLQASNVGCDDNSSFNDLEDMIKDPIAQLDQSVFQRTKELLRTPPSCDGSLRNNPSHVLSADERDLDDYDEALQKYTSINKLWTLSSSDDMTSTNNNTAPSLKPDQSVENQTTDGIFKVPQPVDSRSQYLETSSTKYETPLHSHHENVAINSGTLLAKDNFTLEQPGNFQLRRMTASLNELAQTKTPILPERSKCRKVDSFQEADKKFNLLDFDSFNEISSKDSKSAGNSASCYQLFSSCFSAENTPTLESTSFNFSPKEECMIKLDSPDSVTPTGSPCKTTPQTESSFLDFETPKVSMAKSYNHNLHGFLSDSPTTKHFVKEEPDLFSLLINSSSEKLEDIAFDKFDIVISKDESNLSTPPSCERRASRRFQFRPDLSEDDALFSLTKVEETATDLSDAHENSLIDLEGFDDTNFLLSCTLNFIPKT